MNRSKKYRLHKEALKMNRPQEVLEHKKRLKERQNPLTTSTYYFGDYATQKKNLIERMQSALEISESGEVKRIYSDIQINKAVEQLAKRISKFYGVKVGKADPTESGSHEGFFKYSKDENLTDEQKFQILMNNKEQINSYA